MSDVRSWAVCVNACAAGVCTICDVGPICTLHTGSTQAALLEIHVRHALRFIEELRDSHSTREAVDVYQDMVEVPSIMTEALKVFVWDKLAHEELPKGTIEIVAEPTHVPMFPQPMERKRPKRVG
jgi:hypothetical protein